MGLHNRFPIAQWITDRLHEENHDGFSMHYQTKKPDGLLHPSTHTGCEIAMCHDLDPDIEMNPKTTGSLQTLLTGTLWHAFLTGAWESGEWDGIEARCEVKMGEGLPKGWQGSCDLLLGQFGDGILSEAEWTVFDYKTIAGSGLPYLTEKPKPEQWFQASAYHHAAEAMGYKMFPELCIVQLPVSKQQWKQMEPPFEQWAKPMPRNEVFGEMKRRSRILKNYFEFHGMAENYDPALAPKPMPKVLKTRFNKKLNLTEQVEAPNWRVQFCDSPQCACANQSTDVVSYDESPQEVGSL